MEQVAQLFSPFYKSTGICTDTRKITDGCMFICIQGENFDGNTFASEALEQGAHHVIVDNPDYFDESKSMTLVENSVHYLQQLANFHRKQFDIPVIGITGSNGKTTTKELIHAVLRKKYNVLATIGNLNNHIGVPLTLLRLTKEHEIAIIEMGANRFKDIEELCEIAEPNYGIITNIGKAHLEGFGGFEGVLKTKRELYEAVAENNGVLIVNNDDEVLMSNLPEGTAFTSYGTGPDALFQGELIGLTPYVQMKWFNKSVDSPSVLTTQMVGKYNFYNYMAACTFGELFEVPYKDICAAVEEYPPTNNRSQVQKSERNTLILDCYNANPTSMKSALESFSMMTHAKKLVIIGDMRELGKEAETEHKKVLSFMEDHKIQGYTVGNEFGKFASEAVIKHFGTSEEAKMYFQTSPILDALVLLKGSRGIRLEVLTDIL